MAPKKKKKAAAGPARGFATTSIASKPREKDDVPATGSETAAPKTAGQESAPTSIENQGRQEGRTVNIDSQLSPEEFEKQLEESELQVLVDKHASRVKRDAQRQQAKLQTDKRLLRGQATHLNVHRWLPQELMDQLLDAIKSESRFSASSPSHEGTGTAKPLSEEDATMRLWTLEQTLSGLGFPEARIRASLHFVLDAAAKIPSVSRDSIWGLEEAFDWLARECVGSELPDYDGRAKPKGGPSAGGSPLPSRSHTPVPGGRQDPELARRDRGSTKAAAARKKPTVVCDSDIEPDDLVPQWVSSKASLLEMERLAKDNINPDGEDLGLKQAKLQAKISKIENDVLFDKFVADQQWKAQRIALEKELSASRKQKQSTTGPAAGAGEPSAGEVNQEAERMAAEILAQGDDDMDDIGGLFAGLPMDETDESGKTTTVVSGADGAKITIRDFGKWSGVSPLRALEEACRSRDTGMKTTSTRVSESTFANRHSLTIYWSKPQERPLEPLTPDVAVSSGPTHFVFKMETVATPDAKQSEAFVATYALFHIFGSSPKEDKVFLKLPAVWREYWTELADLRKSKSDEMDRAHIRELRELVRRRQNQEEEDGVILTGAFRGRGAGKGASDREDSGLDRSLRLQASQDQLKQIWAEKSSTHKYRGMLEGRMQLPMWGFRHDVVNAIDQHQVVIICGETGCGKSTQTPSFILEHQLSQGKPCKIYCTEPRRISAISLARRVSEELGENRGDLGTNRSLVGYAIRLESVTSKETRLVYATTGIVMRMLEGSNDLSEVTHLVLDEVHERTIDSDFLLIVLKKLLEKRQDLKIVLMSATVDAERFSAYLGGAPVLNVPGRTFPVEVRYLEDAIELTGYTPVQNPGDKMIDLDDDETHEEERNGAQTSVSAPTYSPSTRASLAQIDEYRIEFDLIVQLILTIAADERLQFYSKAILVFMPGIADIRTLNDLLLGHPFFSAGWYVYPLHSSIATEDQESAFLVPPPGIRKIVIATNIAETGITIPDVTCVIDTGKHKEMRFDERRQMSRLIDTFVSRANAKQRRGRAGRVQNGLCFHLFTRQRHDNVMSDQQTPEMLRLSLQDLAIRVKVCKIGGIEETLSGALDPPSAKNIRRAIDALIDVRALTSGEDLTPLGHQLARLPLDVFLGKLVLLGSVFRCLDMAITVAAILSSKSPFSAPFGQRARADAARQGFRRADSDLLTVYNAYLAWKRVCQANSSVAKEFQFCRKNFLSPQTLANIEDLKGQLLVSLVDAGFLQLTDDERRTLSKTRYSGARGRKSPAFFDVPQRVDLNSDNDVVSASVIAWSFYPKLLVRDVPGSKGLRNVGNNQAISLHPSSMNRGHLEIDWLSYYHIMSSKQVYHAHDTTSVDPFAVALLCGDVRCEMFSGVIVLDGNRGRFSVPDWKSMLVIKILRARLRDLLSRSFRAPGKLPSAQHQRWLDIWQQVFTHDGRNGAIVTVTKG